MEEVNLTCHNLVAFNKMVSSLKFNPDGDLLFATSRDTNCSAACWHTKTGELLGTYSAVGQGNHKFDPAMSACDVSSQSMLFATTSAGEETFIWSVRTGSLLGTISTEMHSGRSVAFSHDDNLLMVATQGRGGRKGVISLYNMPFSPPRGDEDIAKTKLKLSPESTMECDSISWASWGPTNDTIYISDGGYMHIMDVETNRIVRSRQIHMEKPINRFKFEPNYLTLATCSADCTANLLDYRDLSTIQTYTNDLPINDVSISPCSDHVILGGGVDAQDVTTQSGKSDFKVKFFHKVNGTALGEFKCHFGTITAMSFTPDGRGFASAGADSQVKLFHFDENYDKVPGAVPLWTLE